MQRTTLSALIAALFATTPVLAQTTEDPFISTGNVTVGGIATDTSGRDLSKFNEYQDLDNGVLSNIYLRGRNSRSWFDGYGENFGRDDMYINIRGGIYDVFKARAYTNWIPHNLLFNGLTPFAGTGGNNLTATFPQPNPATWNSIDIGNQRKDTGGVLEWQSFSPWYARIDGNQVRTRGTTVGSASNGTSPGNGFVDLALPVDYETNNIGGEIGYATTAMTLSASYTASDFNNSNNTVTWNNPFWANGVDTTYLAPSNQYQRIALNGSFRQLPWNSTLAMRYTWDETTSDVGIGQSVLNGIGAAAMLPVAPSTNTFNGDERRQTFTLGWTATPIEKLDTRLYLNWQKLENKGTQVVFCPTDASSCGGVHENHLWNYEKENAGFDAYYRIGRGNRVGAGYDYNHITQNRHDFDDTSTNTLWVEWRNTQLENVTAKLRYAYLDRRSTFLLGDAGVDANDPRYLQRFVYAFDLAPLVQNRFKLSLDWAPADAVGVAVEYLYKDNDYKSTILGRTGDTRNEIFVNLSYGLPTSWRVSVFADYEHIKYDSYHRNVGTSPCNATTGPDCFDPSAPPTTSSYNWSAEVKNENWLFGIAGDWPVTDRFMLTGSVMYEQVDGSSDMASQNNYGNPLPLPNYPNTKVTSFNGKGTYVFDKNWSFTGGYAYQKYQYSDDQFNGYTNTLPFPGVTNNASQSYLNNWNAYTPYDANIFYLYASYRF